MPNYKPPPLPRELLSSVLQHAVKHLIPLHEIIVLSGDKRKRTSEPFLFDPAAIPVTGNDQTRFTLVLSHLYQRAPTTFDKVAPTIKGSKRTYFALNPEEIFLTGTSNTPIPVPNSPWFVSVNSGADRKETIVKRVMLGMGFSDLYSETISAMSCSSKAKLPWPYSSYLP